MKIHNNTVQHKAKSTFAKEEGVPNFREFTKTKKLTFFTMSYQDVFWRYHFFPVLKIIV